MEKRGVSKEIPIDTFIQIFLFFLCQIYLENHLRPEPFEKSLQVWSGDNLLSTKIFQSSESSRFQTGFGHNDDNQVVNFRCKMCILQTLNWTSFSFIIPYTKQDQEQNTKLRARLENWMVWWRILSSTYFREGLKVVKKKRNEDFARKIPRFLRVQKTLRI